MCIRDRAKAINEEMKIAAVHAIANRAKQPVPDVVNEAYHVNNFTFGPEYFIPKIPSYRICDVATAIAPNLKHCLFYTSYGIDTQFL